MVAILAIDMSSRLNHWKMALAAYYIRFCLSCVLMNEVDEKGCRGGPCIESTHGNDCFENWQNMYTADSGGGQRL